MSRTIALPKYQKVTIGFFFLAICTIRLTAQSSCQFGTINPVSFITYASATLQTTGSIQVSCTSGTAYTISLNAGSIAGATITNRLLQRPNGGTLGYQLFSDASYTTNWGNSAGTNWVTGTGTGIDNWRTVTVYAQMPGGEAFFANQNGGNYNDSVTVTLAWGGGQVISALSVTLQQVNSGCWVGPSALNFGNYTGAVLEATTTLQIGCGGTTPYDVGLDAGTGQGATTTTRKMTGPGGAELNYKLFRNAGYTTNWGNTVGTDTVHGTSNNGVQTLTVYGQMPAGQNVATGNYTDTIIATLTY